MIVTSPAKSKPQVSNMRRVDIPVYGNGVSAPSKPAAKKAKSGMAPWKIVLTSILLGALGYIYISHVFATQNTLREVNTLQRQYESTLRVHEDRALTYDRMTGPTEVYRRAGELGLIHGGASDPIILKRR